ncbi:MAG: HIT domain-containing protein [Candidatus Omnitrophota bacterium]
MERIWAPWRSKYVGLKKQKGCIFCRAAKDKKDAKNYLVFRGEKAFIMLNIFPYNNGHLMIAPMKHTGEITELTDEEMLEIMRLIKKSCKILKKLLKPHAFNVGVNLGRYAGAGVEDHLHFHVVPRWSGDANFMPVVSNTKVIPQSLDELYKKLKKEYGA